MSRLIPELFEEKYDLNKIRIEKRNVDNLIFSISMYTSYTFLVKSYVSSAIRSRKVNVFLPGLGFPVSGMAQEGSVL